MIKPKNFGIMVNPATGNILLMHKQYGKEPRMIKNVTDEVLQCLIADTAVDHNAKQVIRSVKFDDGSEYEVTVTRTVDPDMTKRAEILARVGRTLEQPV